jgi:glycosyltransferase involved in cell wall biosynthesis
MFKYKIAFIGQKGIPASYGGVERHVEELGIRLTQRGYRTIVYTRKNYNGYSGYYKGVRVINLPAIPQKHTEMISHTFFSCLDLFEKDIDIVHIHSVDPAIISFLPRIKAKVVATSHGQAYRREKWGPIAKSISKIAERIYAVLPNIRIAVSKTLKRYYETKYRCNVYYIPNGVNLPVPKIHPASKKFIIDEKEITLEANSYYLYVGRILPTKGVDTLIKGWQIAGQKVGFSLDEKLVIVGGSAYTDDYVFQLKKISNPSIVWLGYRYGDELDWLYANAYCVVIPSEIEGLALTLLEAMSYAKCVIYSDIPENAEAAEEVGIAFHNRNPDNLAEKIKMVLENRKMCQELGEKAQERIKKEYNWEFVVDQTEEVYKLLSK